jgi:hypothetical protein
MLLKYNNLDSMINNFSNKLSFIEPESNDTLEQLEMELGRGILYGLKGQMTKIIKKQIKKSVENGNLDYLFNNSESNINPTDKWKRWHSIRFSKIESINKSNGIADVCLKFIYLKNNKDFIFNLKMRKKNHHWEIVDLTDFLNLGKLIDK